MASKFYHFSQNNSGGSFVGDYHHIIIEADSADEANNLAEFHTDIYFDGCMTGADCDCCGDRWSKVWSYDGDDEPMVYGTPAALAEDKFFGGKTLVRYKNGQEHVFGGEWK